MKIFNTNNKKEWFMLAGGGFIPITNFPAFTNYSAATSLTPFINNLYTYAIGIAAILAVVEIIWGGFLWMGSGASISNKEAGRSKILMSILGLVLVLSPYLILSVLNPSMLSLKLGSNNLALNINDVSTNTTSTLSPVCTNNNDFIFKAYSCSSPNTQKLVKINGFQFCVDGNSRTLATATSVGPVCFSGYSSILSEIPSKINRACNTVARGGTFGIHLIRALSYRVLKVNTPGCSGVVTPLGYVCKILPVPTPTNYVCVYKP